MSLASAAAKPVLWAAVEIGSLTGVSLVTLVILARLLGPVEFGLATLGLMIIQVLILFVEVPFNDAIVQRKDLKGIDLDTAFWTSSGIAAALILGCFATADIVSDAFDEPRLADVVKWLALSILFTALSTVPQAQLRRELRFRELAQRAIVSRIAGAVVAVAMAFAGYGFWSLVAQQLVQSFAATLLLWLTGVWRPRMRFSKSSLSGFFAIGATVSATVFVDLTANRIYSFLVGYFIGVAALGYWNVAMRIADTVMVLVGHAAHQVGLAIFAKQQADPQGLRGGFLAASQMVSLITIPLFTGLIVLAEYLVGAVFGEKWLPSVPIVQIAALGSMLHMTLLFANVVFTAVGKPVWTLVSNCSHFALALTGLLSFYRWGLTAAAIIWIGSYFLVAPLTLVGLRRLIAVQPMALIRTVLPPFVAATIMGGLLVALDAALPGNLPSLAKLAILAPTGALIYIVSIRTLAAPLFHRFVGLAKHAAIRKQIRDEPQNF